LRGRLRFNRFALRYRGPFAHQSNSQTRAFEYPWTYAVLNGLRPNLTIVEIGGGLSGMQFVLAAAGHRVINVDPGARDGSTWGFDPKAHAYLCRLFAAPVRLVPEALSDAGLPDRSADVVMSISVLE